MEEWIVKAKECGFTHAGPLEPAALKVNKMVRDTCASGRCQAYGHNWTCPPACGTLEECAQKMAEYKRGILLQTVGELKKTIDTKGYMETEAQHHEHLLAFAREIRKAYPKALVLGAGGCRVCKECAYPGPCRFPDQAVSSMEAYGLFVTQVCRDSHMGYYYGPKTISYTACVLF